MSGPEDGRKPAPVAIAVIEDAGRILIGRRPIGKPLGGLWEFPGGRIECNETPAQAAVRECREETGLQVGVIRRYAYHECEYAHDRVQLHFFACRLIRTGHPIEPFRWVPREELDRYSFPAGNEEILSLLRMQPKQS